MKRAKYIIPWVLVVILLLIVGWLIISGFDSPGNDLDNEQQELSEDKNLPPTEGSTDGSEEASINLDEARVVVPGSESLSVTLSDGQAYYEDGLVRGDVNLYQGVPPIMIEASGDSYAAAPVVVTSGASGVFIYLYIFEEQTDGWVAQDWVLLGDRIRVENLHAAGLAGSNTIHVDLLVRDEGEPLAAKPTIPETVYYRYFPDSDLSDIESGLVRWSP